MAKSPGFYLRFPCPECGAMQKVLPAQADTEIRCSECPSEIHVPPLEKLKAVSRVADAAPRRSEAAARRSRNELGASQRAPHPIELNIIRGHMITFACPVCHTMMRASEEELGHHIMCPNCFSPITVGGDNQKQKPTESSPSQSDAWVLEDTGDEDVSAVSGDDDDYRLAETEDDQPRPTAPPAAASSDLPEEDEYRLSDPVERPAADAPGKGGPQEAASGRSRNHRPPSRTRTRRFELETASGEEEPASNQAGAYTIEERNEKESLEDRLRAARAARESQEPPDRPFLSGVFNFLLYGATWTRWLGLSAGGALVYFLVSNAVYYAINYRAVGEETLFYSLIYAALGAAIGVIWIVVAAVMALAVVQDTAAGSDEVESWPDYVFLDWMGHAFYLINALAFSALPGFLLASAFEEWGPWRWTAPGVSAALFFPMVLLSQLHGDSPFSILTAGVLRSCVAEPLAWLTFYCVSGLALAAALALGGGALALLGYANFLAALILGTVASAALLVYSRLVGRLAWFCEEIEPEIGETAEDETDEERVSLD